MSFLEILSPGAQTSVQDPGRPGLEHWGVSPSGAADPVSLEIGNRCLGNPPGAPALEMTVLGARVRFEERARICLSGADMPAQIDGEPLARGEARDIAAGQTLFVGPAARGCRAYLCVQGGLAV